MKITLKLLLTGVCVIAVQWCACQSKIPSQRVGTFETQALSNEWSPVENFDGTYQFIYTKGVVQAFTDEIYSTIEKNRKQDEDNTLVLSAYCQLLILSRNKVNAVDFKKIEKPYIIK